MLLLALVIVASTALSSRPAPTRAAAPAIADFFPDKTFIYAEFDTNNLPATLDNIVTLANQLGANIPKDWRTLATTQLSQSLKTDVKFDFDKDLIGWIGDRVAYGVYVPDAAFNVNALRQQPATPATQPQSAVLITVKDEAKADAFFKDVIQKNLPADLKPTTDTLNGETVTLYALPDKTVLARWKGYALVGQAQFVFDTVKNKQATLTGNTTYKKLLATLKPGTLGSVYVRTPLSTNSSAIGGLFLGLLGPSISSVFKNIVDELNGTSTPPPTPTPTPTPSPSPEEQRLIDTFFALGGTLYSIRGEGKALILDSTSAFDADAVKRLGDLLGVDFTSVLAAPKAVTGKLTDAIPANATAVILGSDIPQIYNSYLVQLVGVQKAVAILDRRPLKDDPMKTATNQIEGGLKLFTGLDLKTDILSWMGDYAIYVTDDKGGPLDTATQGLLPYAENVVIASNDPAKSAAFAAALVKLIQSSQRSSSPATMTPDASGLFTLALDPQVNAKLGTVDGNFVVSTDAKFTLKPDGALKSSTAWQNATKFAPKGYTLLMYLDVTKVGTLVDTLSALSAGSPSSQAQTAQLKAALAPFESALIVYTPLEAGLSTTSFVLIQK
jgi:hypothetical protein